MGLIKDFLNRNKKEALSDATISIQNKKINEQMDLLQHQQEKIDAIVAKMRSVASEVKETKKEIDGIKEKRNKCVSTYTRYNPKEIEDFDNNFKIRRLSKDSEYNYIVTLVADKNKKDEIVMGQFNNGDIKTITDKFEEMLKFQANLQFGEIDKDVINEYYKKLEEYAELNNITITKEGKEILTNTKNESKNISKTIIYMGDDNTIEKTIIKDNKDILNDLNNYAFDELPEMRATDKIIEKIVDINKQENIEELLSNNKDTLNRYLRENTEAKETIKKLHRNSIETDICLDAMKYIEEDKENFEKTEEYNYMRVFTEGKYNEAKNYYNTMKLDISKLSTKLSKGDTAEDIKKKMQINRFLHDKHSQNIGELNPEHENMYNSFLDNIKPDPNYEIINSARQKEKMYLASIIDSEKTKLVNENKENIEDYNELLDRQDFGNRAKYNIPDGDREHSGNDGR